MPGARPVTLMPTATFAGVTPVTVAVSQDPPLVVDALALKAIDEPELLIAICWFAGIEP